MAFQRTRRHRDANEKQDRWTYLPSPSSPSSGVLLARDSSVLVSTLFLLPRVDLEVAQFIARLAVRYHSDVVTEIVLLQELFC